MSDAPSSSGPLSPGERELVLDPGSFLPEGVAVSGIGAPDPAGTGEVDVSALAQIEHELGAVDAALVAIDAGTYGRCRACDTPIDDADLAADPTTSACPSHP